MPDRGRSACKAPSLLVLDHYIYRRVVPFVLVVLVACFCWGNVRAFISFCAGERGLTGAILDSRGENVIVYSALFLTAAGLLCLGLAESDWVMLMAGALLGVGFGNFQSASQAIALTLVPKERFGQATSTFFIFFDPGMGLGPYLFGSFVLVLGYGGLYIPLSGVAVLSVVFHSLLHGWTQRDAM